VVYATARVRDTVTGSWQMGLDDALCATSRSVPETLKTIVTAMYALPRENLRGGTGRVGGAAACALS